MIIININDWLSVPIDNDYQYQLVLIISWLIVVPIIWPMVWPIVHQLLYNLYDQLLTNGIPMVIVVYNAHTFYNSTFYYKVLQITFFILQDYLYKDGFLQTTTWLSATVYRKVYRSQFYNGFRQKTIEKARE